SGIVEAEQNQPLIVAIRQLRLRLAAVKVDGPRYTWHAANSKDRIVGDCFEVIDVASIWIHNPDVRAVRVMNLARCTLHHATEYRALLRDQKTSECYAKDDGVVLASISREHSQRNPGHDDLLFSDCSLSGGRRVQAMRPCE